MREVNYISSSGLKVFISAWRRAQKTGGKLILVGLTDRVREVFAVSGFDSVLPILPSVDDALADLAADRI